MVRKGLAKHLLVQIGEHGRYNCSYNCTGSAKTAAVSDTVIELMQIKLASRANLVVNLLGFEVGVGLRQ